MRIAAIIVLIFFTGCNGLGKKEADSPIKMRIPRHFPQPEIPPDNELTQLRVELGKRLFYDKRLSKDGSTSCGSCHVLSSAFTDGKKTSPGFSGKFGKRNAPTLANLAWMPRFMMEGGVPTLELQVLAPIIDSVEMNVSFSGKAAELARDRKLNDLSQAAYGREIDPYVITRAIAAFERTMISGDSRYDRYKFEDKKDQMNETEIRGMELFFSEKTNCSSCHSDIFFTDFGYHNVGLYTEYNDRGRERITYSDADIGRFKTPTLRNIELTAPYMHDGSVSTLEEVIDFFNSGGNGHINQDPRVKKLGLTGEEKKELLAFLKCLTDWNFVQNAAFLPLQE